MARKLDGWMARKIEEQIARKLEDNKAQIQSIEYGLSKKDEANTRYQPKPHFWPKILWPKIGQLKQQKQVQTKKS